MQVEVEVDTSQFIGLSTQQKLDTDLNKLVEGNVDKRHDDSSSDVSMEDRHQAVREHVKLRERSQRVETHERTHRVEQRTPRNESQRTHRTDYRRDNRWQDEERPYKYNRSDQHSKGSYARSSHEQPGSSSYEQKGRSSKDQYEQSGDKRKFTKINEPLSPESIRKIARNVQDRYPEIFEWHSACHYRKLFQYIRGEPCLHAEIYWRI